MVNTFIGLYDISTLYVYINSEVCAVSDRGGYLPSQAAAERRNDKIRVQQQQYSTSTSSAAAVQRQPCFKYSLLRQKSRCMCVVGAQSRRRSNDDENVFTSSATTMKRTSWDLMKGIRTIHTSEAKKTPVYSPCSMYKWNACVSSFRHATDAPGIL